MELRFCCKKFVEVILICNANLIEGLVLFYGPLYTGGVVDSTHQSLFLILMVLCPEDVCKASIMWIFILAMYITILFFIISGSIWRIK